MKTDPKGGKNDGPSDAEIEQLLLQFGLLTLGTSPAVSVIDGIINDGLDLPVGLNSSDGILSYAGSIGT